VPKRCSWAGVDGPLLLQYHDDEWGVPVHSDRKHFEVLVLSGAQAGLSWSLVLKRRQGYRRAFDNFDPEKVAHYSERRIQSLTSDPEIIRNRMKIAAAVRNARGFLEIEEEYGDFDSYCWRFVGGRPQLNHWKATRQIPATSPESVAFTIAISISSTDSPPPISDSPPTSPNAFATMLSVTPTYSRKPSAV